MAQYNVGSSMADRIRLREAAEAAADEAGIVIWQDLRQVPTPEAAWQYADAAFDVALNADGDEPFVDDEDEARGWFVQPFADALIERVVALASNAE